LSNIATRWIKKFHFDQDPELEPDLELGLDPDPNPELPKRSDPDMNKIFSDPINWLHSPCRFGSRRATLI